jgi:hypothetical protein
MKKPMFPVGRLAIACVTLAWAAHGQIAGPTLVAVPTSASLLAILGAVPPPADDPMSDPAEKFHQVKPLEFDPDHTDLVQAAWLNGTGCPSSLGCLPGDQDAKDEHNEGLLLVKTGPTSTNASAIAELKEVRGVTVTELGYDIRKPFPAGNLDVRGSHCGAGAPRLNLITSDGTTVFIGCNSPAPVATSAGAEGWTRLRWTIPPTQVQRILIVFDEGQDTGPDNFGAAFLDNVDVNGEIVGSGPTDAR